MSPFVSNTIPEPRPPLVSIWTTDGDTRLNTLTNAACSSDAAEVEAAGPVVAARLEANPTPPATHNETAAMRSGTLSRFMPLFYPSRLR